MIARPPSEELLALFFQEVTAYLPQIRQSLVSLTQDYSHTESLEELHRLFHNIKGAAGQVQLVDLSHSAKIVEMMLSDIVEGKQSVTAQFLASLSQVVDIFDEFLTAKQVPPPEDTILYPLISSLFHDAPASAAGEATGSMAETNRIHNECSAEVRSVLPLLQELIGYISLNPDANYRKKIYKKLALAVQSIATASQAAGLLRHSQLMTDFFKLLQKIQNQPFCIQPELPELIGDFLQFCSIVYANIDNDGLTIVERVQERLRILDSLLTREAYDEPSVLATDEESPLFDDVFADIETDADTGFQLEEMTDSLLIDDQPEFITPLATDEPEESVDEEKEEEPFPGDLLAEGEQALDEEQQILMDIFRSECEEHLIVINQSLNSLENSVLEPTPLSAELRDSLSIMRRAVHTLKGAAAMTNMSLTAKGAHALEDLLDWLHDDAEEVTPEEIDIIANGIDTLELLSQSGPAENSTRLDAVVNSIQDYLGARQEISSTEGVESYGEDFEVATEPPPATTPDTVVEEPQATLDLPGETGILRVKLDDLDELVGIEGELVVARGAMEKMLEEVADTLFEMETVKENLKRKSQELETGFEGQSLYGLTSQEGDTAGSSDFSEFDPIELDRYSQLNLIIRSLNEISVDVNSIFSTLVSLSGDLRGQIGKQQLTMRLMQEKLMRIRMTPMSTLSRILFRTVRETARKLEKKANLIITGEDVYMDRFVWAKITDPLMHMLRNAVDHGIEPAEERLALGKPETGTVKVEADQRSRFVILRISDDGAGLNLQAIKDRIKTDGLAPDPDGLSEKEILEFLFHPSFTTRHDISTISGRGIGLDVVRKNIQDLRGSIEIINHPGSGVTFEIRIPFSMSVNRAVMVSVASRVFALPLQDIHLVKRFAAKEIEISDGVFLLQGDQRIPIINLGYYLQLEPLVTNPLLSREGMLVVLFHKGEQLFGVSIDSVVDQREIIVKNLGSHLTNVLGISGVTLTGSGDLIPIVNLRELVETKRTHVASREDAAVQGLVDKPLRVLIIDDSISVRHSVARLIEGRGWKQVQAVDGVDALAKLETFTPDVIILDIEMPRMNGYEFKTNINNNDQLKNIPVVMLTSRASEKHQQKARELGIAHYMTKPYQEEVFLRLLETIRTKTIH